MVYLSKLGKFEKILFTSKIIKCTFLCYVKLSLVNIKNILFTRLIVKLTFYGISN